MSVVLPSLSESALLLIGHGSTKNPDSSAPTREQLVALRQRGIFKEVHAGFRKEQPSIQEALSCIESRIIYIVPNFISEGYFTKNVMPRELGLTGSASKIDGRILIYCKPVGSHPKVTDIILHRAREVAPDADLSKTSLIVVGHGTERDKNSSKAVRKQVSILSEKEYFGEVLAAYMEEAPFIKDWAEVVKFPDVIVVPFFISDGLHSYEDIPVLLGISEAGKTQPLSESQTVFDKNPYQIAEKKLCYTRAIGTEPGFTDIIVDQARQAREKENHTI